MQRLCFVTSLTYIHSQLSQLTVYVCVYDLHFVHIVSRFELEKLNSELLKFYLAFQLHLNLSLFINLDFVMILTNSGHSSEMN